MGAVLPQGGGGVAPKIRMGVSQSYVQWRIEKYETGRPEGTFQVYIFKSVQILAYFFTLKIGTIFSFLKGGNGPLNTPLSTFAPPLKLVRIFLGLYLYIIFNMRLQYLRLCSL